MNTRSNFKLTGCGTAIVTPFQADESIDEAALRRLIDRNQRAADSAARARGDTAR